MQGGDKENYRVAGTQLKQEVRGKDFEKVLWAKSWGPGGNLRFIPGIQAWNSVHSPNICRVTVQVKRLGSQEWKKNVIVLKLTIHIERVDSLKQHMEEK